MVSKIDEKILYEQTENYANEVLVQKLFWYRKGYSTWYALVKFKKNENDCLDHYLWVPPSWFLNS